MTRDPMAEAYRARFRAVDWTQVPSDIVEVLWRMALVACRASRGACWCGTHVTTLEDQGLRQQRHCCAHCGRAGVPLIEWQPDPPRPDIPGPFPLVCMLGCNAAGPLTRGQAVRWARRWKRLAKRMRVRHRNALELAVADRDGAREELLAAERAREQAESEHEATLRDLDVRGQQLDGAVAAAADLKRERDTARSERDSWKGRAQLWQHMCETDLQAAETALASAREIVDAIPESVFEAAEQGMLTADDAIEAMGDLRIIRTLLTSHPAPVARERADLAEQDFAGADADRKNLAALHKLAQRRLDVAERLLKRVDRELEEEEQAWLGLQAEIRAFLKLLAAAAPEGPPSTDNGETP